MSKPAFCYHCAKDLEREVPDETDETSLVCYDCDQDPAERQEQYDRDHAYDHRKNYPY